MGGKGSGGHTRAGMHREGRPPGYPKTGGRKKGTPNKMRADMREELERLKGEGTTPLQYLLAIMRDEKQDPDRRFEAARAAAPYVHPKLQTVKVQGDKDAPLFDLSTLTDSELAFLRRTILKATPLSGDE